MDRRQPRTGRQNAGTRHGNAVSDRGWGRIAANQRAMFRGPVTPAATQAGLAFRIMRMKAAHACTRHRGRRCRRVRPVATTCRLQRHAPRNFGRKGAAPGIAGRTRTLRPAMRKPGTQTAALRRPSCDIERSDYSPAAAVLAAAAASFFAAASAARSARAFSFLALAEADRSSLMRAFLPSRPRR